MNNNKINVALVAIACSLAAVQLIASSCQATTDDGQRLCGQPSTSNALKLNSIGQLLSTSTDGCSQYVKEAFNELVELVQLKGVCTMDHAKQITRYNAKYLATKELASRLPEELVHFALAFGMRVGKLCKKYMRIKLIGHGEDDSDESMPLSVSCYWTYDNDDFNALTKIENKRRFRFGFASMFPELVSEHKPKLGVTKVGFLKVKETCAKQLRPIYGLIVMPVAHLSRNGLDLEFTEHFGRYEDDQYSIRIEDLLKIVFLCEALNQFEIVESRWGFDKNEFDDDDDENENDLDDLFSECDVHEKPDTPIMPIDMSLNDCVNQSGPDSQESKFCLYGHELDQDQIDASYFKIDSPIEYLEISANITDLFRGELFLKAMRPSSMFSYLEIQELLEVASVQVNDANQNQDRDLELAKMELMSVTEQDRTFEQLIGVISRMIEEDKPLVRELAIRFQILVISLKVARSYDYSNKYLTELM